jgi:monoamine oxidase
MKENSPIVDVVVIGAGPAGIGAASILKKKGLNV